jgi:broad specificity phosphatase PhoE
MRAIFVRHGQSTGNAGIPCPDLALMELTDLGKKQSRQIARTWTETPSLIVTSPYLRTQQTAEPTVKRFKNVPVEVWPIQEFTYLQPLRWNGTRSIERRLHLGAYWQTGDPDYCDGPGAESFSTLLRRTEAALLKLEALPDDALVYVFSHGQFMQALCSTVTDNGTTDREKMELFTHSIGTPSIANAERMFLFRKNRRWGHGLDAGVYSRNDQPPVSA